MLLSKKSLLAELFFTLYDGVVEKKHSQIVSSVEEVLIIFIVSAVKCMIITILFYANMQFALITFLAWRG
jgi:hypothetical protein